MVFASTTLEFTGSLTLVSILATTALQNDIKQSGIVNRPEARCRMPVNLRLQYQHGTPILLGQPASGTHQSSTANQVRVSDDSSVTNVAGCTC